MKKWQPASTPRLEENILKMCDERREINHDRLALLVNRENDQMQQDEWNIKTSKKYQEELKESKMGLD